MYALDRAGIELLGVPDLTGLVDLLPGQADGSGRENVPVWNVFRTTRRLPLRRLRGVVLVPRDLSDAVRAHLIARRKELYERIHPETKRGAAPGKAGGGKKAKDPNLGSFVDATAEATGRSRTATARDAQRGNALGDDALKVAGTSLDKGVELDALAKLPPEDPGSR